MNGEDYNVQEYLLAIRQRKSELLNRLRERGELHDYTLNMHKRMIAEYPEMIVHVYTKEEIEDDGRGGNNNG